MFEPTEILAMKDALVHEHDLETVGELGIDDIAADRLVQAIKAFNSAKSVVSDVYRIKPGCSIGNLHQS